MKKLLAILGSFGMFTASTATAATVVACKTDSAKSNKDINEMNLEELREELSKLNNRKSQLMTQQEDFFKEHDKELKDEKARAYEDYKRGVGEVEKLYVKDADSSFKEIKVTYDGSEISKPDGYSDDLITEIPGKGPGDYGSGDVRKALEKANGGKESKFQFTQSTPTDAYVQNQGAKPNWEYYLVEKMDDGEFYLSKKYTLGNIAEFDYWEKTFWPQALNKFLSNMDSYKKLKADIEENNDKIFAVRTLISQKEKEEEK